MKKSLYATPVAFRQALEIRLNNLARRENSDIQRLRRQVAFDRLLCRLFQDSTGQWILKGGYAMELRLLESRATRDIDLVVRQPVQGAGRLPERILQLFQASAAKDLNDFFLFAIGQPTRDLAGAPYGSARYPVEARMAGRIFARFHVDVAAGDLVLEPVEMVRGRDWLAFAERATALFPMISKEQQFAEKFHAYTLPRAGGSNTRARDLLDMFILVRIGMLADRVGEAVDVIFNHRNTHPIPAVLPPPPEAWAAPFAALAGECRISENIAQTYSVLAGFLRDLNSSGTPISGKGAQPDMGTTRRHNNRKKYR